MEFIENVDKNKYEKFASNHQKAHFMQSYYWGEVMKEKNFISHYVGIEENGELIATALLLQKKLLYGYSYFYCPRGYILDYNNLDLLKIFTNYIKKYAKKNKAIFVKIDPDIKLHDLDVDGNIIGNKNYKLIDYLKKLGYKNKGFNKSFVNEQPRFTFRLNIDKDFDEIYKNIHPTTRKILNKKNQYNLNVYIGDESDLNCFYDTMKDTAIRENLKLTPLSYYTNFYKILNNHNMSDLYVVKVNINDLKETYKNKIENIKKEIISLSDSKYKNAEKRKNIEHVLNKQIEKLNKELNEMEHIKNKEITLSSIITVKYKDTVWTIHGGNSTLLRELNSNYLLYYTIIKDAYDQGYKKVDFFGTSGIANPDKNDPIYGIHLFKKRFGGEYTEFIGEYDLIVNPLLYFSYKKLLPLYRKYKKNKKI